MDSSTIRALYENVLQDDVRAHSIRDNEIRIAINNMKEVYKPDPASLQSNVVDVANYDDVVHRCAYLHKYAPLHTALVSEMLQLVMRQHAHVFQAILNKQGSFNVCSLGGGPGNDVIAVLDVLHTAIPGYYQVNATIVDIMVNWKFTFESILNELSSRDYGPLSDHVSEQYFSWRYEKANLLSKMTDGANRAIASANLITMVKFVSASSCKDTATMIRDIFRRMQKEALVLFIDNDGGSFYKMAKNAAMNFYFEEVFLLEHHCYLNETFKVKKTGLPLPCHETKVTVCIWRKRFDINLTRKKDPLLEPSEVRVLHPKMPRQDFAPYNSDTVMKGLVHAFEKRARSQASSHPSCPLPQQRYSTNFNNGILNEFPRHAGDSFRDVSGSSSRGEGSNWWKRVLKAGNRLFWFLCKTGLVLLLCSLCLPKKVVVVRKNIDRAEYFLEVFPSVWN